MHRLSSLHKLLLFVFLMGTGSQTPYSLRAQETKTSSLSLEAAVERALEEGWTMAQKRAATRAARAGYQRSRATYLPQVELQENVVRTNNPLQSFGIKLQQEEVTEKDFDPARLNDPAAISNFQTQLTLKQPIINPGAWQERAAAEARYRATANMESFSEARVRFMVTQSYYGIQLQQRQVQVLRQSLQAAREMERVTGNAREEGMVQKADLLAVQLRVRQLENQIESARDEAVQAREQLALMLGDTAASRLRLSDSLQMPEEENTNSPERLRLEGRGDLLAMQAGLEAKEHMLQSQRQAYWPQLNGFGNYQWNDNEAIGFGGENWMLGLQLEWKLFAGYDRIGAIRMAGAQVQEERARMQQYEARQRVELRQARRQRDLAGRQLPIARLNVEQAEEAYRLRRNRQEEGMALTTDLLQAEAALSEARLRQLQTLYQYHIAGARLDLLQAPAP